MKWGFVGHSVRLGGAQVTELEQERWLIVELAERQQPADQARFERCQFFFTIADNCSHDRPQLFSIPARLFKITEERRVSVDGA
jgi:hypothetical protein